MSERRVGAVRWTVIALAYAALAGCAGSASTEGARLDSVTSISLYRYVQLPPAIHYVSSGQVWGTAMGVVGLGVATATAGGIMSSQSGPREPLRATLENSHVDVGAIFVEELRAALARRSRFRLVEDQADAEMSISVSDYGFHVAGPFTTRMRVLLSVECSLTDKGGHLLFKNGEDEKSSDATTYAMGEYLEDPARLQAAFHEAAAQVAAKQVDNLVRRYPDAAPAALPREQAANPGNTSDTTREER